MLCWDWPVWSVELLSDLDDSDRRWAGMANAEPWSSVMVVGAADIGAGLNGSSNVTVCLLAGDSVRWFMIAFFSFLAPDKTLTRDVWSC